MLKSHEKFHSANGKRLVLIADDEFINREILRSILEDEYELLFAENGQEALQIILENRAILSLVLLDLLMPVMSGMELLEKLKADSELRSIPVIVITSDQKAEVECLTLGVSDFIPKPYPQADIIRARILHTIELSEDRQIISSTERDPLTGLYNREFFYSYAEQFDQHHWDLAMDAIVVDVNHFHMINERFGTTYGDAVLRRIGERVREMVQDTGGIVCRREADTFMVYCPHGKDYGAILEEASIGLAGDDAVDSRVRLRMGVYENVDKTLDIERRFDRAQMAADTVRSNFTRPIGLYDEALHQEELYAEQLIEEFPAAIRKKQFQVYYQPKFDIRSETPVLASAEALVRWMHPELGMISPGVFIPLFEENGLIQTLDDYVWRQTAADIRRWKDRFGFAVPVSVNVSRIDMYDPKLVDVLQEIVEENGLTAEDIHLEITESAYTQDSDQIIRTVNTLRELGFRIEMDDFGTGYSSLNMISDLPIDVLKLDMQFVRNAFKQNRDTRMLEVIIDIAGYINVPVIAEGVETEDQLIALRELGCDHVQGYYFSKPVPAEEYEVFLTARKTQMEEKASDASDETEGERDLPPKRTEESAPEAPGETEEENARGGIPLRVTSYVFAILAFLAALTLFISGTRIKTGNHFIEQTSETYMSARAAAMDLEAGSDYLTESVRLFVVTGDLQYLEDFFEEADETRQRDNALATLESLLDGNSSEAYNSLMTALNYSNELMEREYLAMRLMAEANRYDSAVIPDVVSSVALSEEDLALTAEEQRDKAQSLVFDEEYMACKARIREQVDRCTDLLIGSAREAMETASDNMDRLLRIHTGLVTLLLLIVLIMTVFISSQVRKPLTKMVEQMSVQKSIPLSGASELRFVIKTYNRILKESQTTHRKLTYEASHDPLTGLYNRSAYEMFMQSTDGEHIALLLVDVDEFKGINDRYGHDVGDLVLKRVSSILKDSFRSVDIICRIGGDEFVVIMTRVNSSMAQMVQNKIAHANMLLQNPEDGLPKISLSVGVAFSDRENPQGDIFKDADSALYRVKEAGRCGCAIF